jgi:predicted O-linked N-acetylglucosamine transferase (SPINDLY family)
MDLLEALFNAGRHAELESRARLLVEQHPASGYAWSVLGTSLQVQGKEALHCTQKAAELMPDDAVAHSNLGDALQALGKFESAAESYRRALEIQPNFAEVHNNLGVILQGLGHPDGAAASFRRALEINPDFAEAHCNLGNALQALGQFDDAAASFRRALEIKSDYVEAHINLGVVLRDLGQQDGSAASFRRALEIQPELAEVHNNLGSILQDLGQLDDVEARFRRALEIQPDFAEAHSNLLFHLCHSEEVDAQALFAEHRRFADQFEAPLRINWPQHTNSRDPDRCLRVGFVSGDLRTHAVAFFIEPLLVQLSGYPQLSLHAYANDGSEDSVTQRLRGYFKHWHPIVGLSDAALAEKIRTDGIDILIDLSGHTAKHRLLTFARKPAPVQASWMGYAGTTGLSAMDYYLADHHYLPPSQFDDLFTEKLVQLPASAPFLPFDGAPPVNALPALSNAYVTFGSFNLPRKLNPSVIALWSQLLRALPDARMVLGAMPQTGENNTLIGWFDREGIDRERLIFYPQCQMKDYLGLHHQVDICLDTFPYPGGTTSCHALWMGVPTLTMAGTTPVSRVGASVQNSVGLEGFVACSKAEFVEKGLYWAGNLAQLSEIRTGLRERFAKSAIGQPALIAAGVERALRIMWQRWCSGLPAESFEVTMQDINRTAQETCK